MGIFKVCFVGPKTIQTLFIQKTEYRLPKTNPNKVLAELKEYATEVDVDFVRKAVRAIGRCAIKVSRPEGPKTVHTRKKTFVFRLKIRLNDVSKH